MFDTYVGTTSGVFRLTDSTIELLGLESERIWAIHAWREGGKLAILAGSYGDGLYRSEDGGETWSCTPVIKDEDIHHIIGHPNQPDLLYASLGYASLTHRWSDDEWHQFGGIGRSRDGGKTWQKLETDYTRATLVPPSRPDLIVAGPAPEVGRKGRTVVSSNGGDTWEPASDGIETPMPDMVELFVAAPDDDIWAITSGGRLLRATPGEWCWRSALPGEAYVNVQSVSFIARES
jgi:photosystem II stability/assembly factor-like uncharacterized protein